MNILKVVTILLLFVGCQHTEHKRIKLDSMRTRSDIASWVRYATWIAQAPRKEAVHHTAELKRSLKVDPSDELKLRLALTLMWRGNGTSDLRKSIGLLRGLKRKRSLSTEVLDFVSLNLSHSIALNELYRNHDKHLQQEIVARKKLEDKINGKLSFEVGF